MRLFRSSVGRQTLPLVTERLVAFRAIVDRAHASQDFAAELAARGRSITSDADGVLGQLLG